jgi:hypothetical protein
LSSRVSSKLFLAILIAACSLDSGIENSVEYQLDGLFDSARYQVTIPGINDTLHVSDSLRGTLTIHRLHSGFPRGSFSIVKCGVTCYGYTQAASTPENSGWRSGDSIDVLLFFDAARRIQLNGLDLGDSIVGTMNSWRFHPGGEPAYHGRFVARRP